MNRLPIFAIGLFANFLCSFVTFAQENNYVDFSDQITPICEIAKVTVKPPEGWVSVPIDSGEDTRKGCQMMLFIDEALIGIVRILSFDLKEAPPEVLHWSQYIVRIESALIEPMGYQLIEPIWQRQEVPITGNGFTGAKAIGFSAKIKGDDNPQEAHFLVFENPTHKYLISLLTPAKSVGDGEHYAINLKGMGAVMQNLKAAK